MARAKNEFRDVTEPIEAPPFDSLDDAPAEAQAGFAAAPTVEPATDPGSAPATSNGSPNGDVLLMSHAEMEAECTRLEKRRRVLLRAMRLVRELEGR